MYIANAYMYDMSSPHIPIISLTSAALTKVELVLYLIESMFECVYLNFSMNIYYYSFSSSRKVQLQMSKDKRTH